MLWKRSVIKESVFGRDRPILLEWFDAKKERIAVCGVVLPPVFAFINHHYKLSIAEPWQTIVVIAGSAALIVATWFAYGALASMASSLGYTEVDPTINLEVTGHGNVVTIPTRSELQAPFEKYDGTDILSPLQSARSRILEHIKKLRNNSVTNLFIGIGIAAIGIIILFTAIFQIEQFVDRDKHVLDTNGFVFFALLPKLSVTVFVQIFSYFFLAMYRANQNDIKYFQNEITFLDSLATAVIAAQRPGSAPNMKLVLTALSKNERNRVMKKSDKLIVSTDEAEFIRALSVLSRATNRVDKD
jgi:hypothetical protein